ncbi:TRAP transporter small permease subunit [Rubrimonas cliftonensis]|uniref:TRAP transporter small permease protein n=1 Tax=Rubrimonas cliftonensis TaxID=89524 RepID=A0A1H3WWD9_9RHOB|nr:TRAP transporter small permease [Rubrimonas cliftonensis]SDZ91449.1 TRAP-type mannitol/chloroaromatic compound transport system, small permease component [Rubrimonas cliftonensis]
MLRLVAGLRSAARVASWGAGALIMAAAILIGVDVMLRGAFRVSIGGADELAGYALAAAAAWGLGLALTDRAHIRIDSLYGLFPMRLRLILDFLGLGLFIGFFGFACWHGLGVLEQSLQSGSRSQSALQVPTAWPQALWLAGLVASLLVGVALWAAAAALVLRGEAGAATRLISTRSAQEEVAEEIAATHARAE